MKLAACIAFCASFVVSRVASTATTGLYSFKCGDDVYMCPGLTTTTICSNSGITGSGKYYTLTSVQCSALIPGGGGSSGSGDGKNKSPSNDAAKAGTTDNKTSKYHRQLTDSKNTDTTKSVTGSVGGGKSGSTGGSSGGVKTTTTCPNGKTISSYVKYGCTGGTGMKTEGGKSATCTCSSGSCGLPKCEGGITNGDPHFRTHDGTQYDFHGECDLVMARSTTLISGFDLDVHARTTDMGGWSLVSHAAVRLGDDVLEISNDGTHYFNGVPDVEFPIYMAGYHRVTKTREDLDSDSTNPEQKYRTWYVIDIHEDAHKILIVRFHDMITIRVNAELHDTVGMLGTPSMGGGLAGRDPETLFEDPDEMGMEWQVTDAEPMLFQEARSPQFPDPCRIPDASARRLRHSERSVREASGACANVDGAMLKNCIDDVLLTGDKYVAHAYIGL